MNADNLVTFEELKEARMDANIKRILAGTGPAATEEQMARYAREGRELIARESGITAADVITVTINGVVRYY